MHRSPTAVVIGAGGQDGVLLSAFLLVRGYQVHAVARPGTDLAELTRRAGAVQVHRADLTAAGPLSSLLSGLRPDEIYNLAAVSSVARSWQDPVASFEANLSGVLGLLEIVRSISEPGYRPRLFQASSAEIFGTTAVSPQNEQTPMAPVSPYGISKAAAQSLVRSYRTAYGLHAVAGILYNHESPLRPDTFVTRKITRAAAEIRAGLRTGLELGTLDVVRDWGYAGDFVEAMWLSLQPDEPQDYLVATGIGHSLRDFVATAFAAAGVEDWPERVTVAEHLRRPIESAALIGDSSRARSALGWSPRTSFEQMIQIMVENDLNRVRESEHR